jgi:hypothetical protein
MIASTRRLLAGAGLAAAAITLAACGDSSTAPGGEQELISRVTITLTPSSGAPIVSYIDDPDGNGPQAPSAQVGAIALTPGATYTGTVTFENRLANPPEDITEEVEEEDDEHRVYYTVFGGITGAGLVITPQDTDSQGRPLGLRFTATVNQTVGGQSGSIQVVLCHYDDAPKVASSTTCQGDTDIDVRFNAVVNN